MPPAKKAGKRSRSGTPQPEGRRGREWTVAVIGSSGGGTAALGPAGGAAEAVGTLQLHLEAAGITLAHVQYTWCAMPMDTATPDTKAELWGLERDGTAARTGKLVQLTAGPLSHVNEMAHAMDRAIAAELPYGIVMFSGDADGVNHQVISPPSLARHRACTQQSTLMHAPPSKLTWRLVCTDAVRRRGRPAPSCLHRRNGHREGARARLQRGLRWWDRRNDRRFPSHRLHLRAGWHLGLGVCHPHPPLPATTLHCLPCTACTWQAAALSPSSPRNGASFQMDLTCRCCERATLKRPD